jgi:signal transduction histidine kinase
MKSVKDICLASVLLLLFFVISILIGSIGTQSSLGSERTQARQIHENKSTFSNNLFPTLCRRISRTVQELEHEQRTLSELLSKSPPVGVRFQQARFGFHSRPIADESATQTLQINLPQPHTIDTIVLVPARVDSTMYLDEGYGFPIRFKIGVIDQENQYTLVADETASDFPNPGLYPYQVRGRWESIRSVRIEVTKLWPLHDRWAFALGEVMVLAGDRNLGVGSEVKVSRPFYRPPVWVSEYVVDGQSILGLPVSNEMSSTSGYLSERTANAATTKWIQVDLERSVQIDEVRLIPARPTDYADHAGYGFPVRFRILVSETPDFKDSIILADQTSDSYPNPGDNPVVLPSIDVIHGRYVRLEAIELWGDSWKYVLALAELQVFVDGKNIALAKPVTAKDVIENTEDHELWLPKYIVDGKSSQNRLLPLSDWLGRIESRRVAEARLVDVVSELEDARGNVLASIGVLGMGVIGSLGYWIYRQRLQTNRETEKLRQRISGDLHDDIGSNLGSIALTSNLALRSSTLPGETRRDLERIHDTAAETLVSMRDLVWLIDTSQSTVNDLRLRVGQVAEAMLQGIQHSVSIEGIDEKSRLSLASRRYIHLSIKEILHNIVQHAQATEVSIAISSLRNQIRVQVHDNGHGFNVDETSRGHGLKSLRRRAAAFHGTIHIVSSPNNGTTVDLRCPFRERA